MLGNVGLDQVVPPQPFSTLPNEICGEVMSHLSCDDLGAMRNVCRRFSVLAKKSPSLKVEFAVFKSALQDLVEANKRFPILFHSITQWLKEDDTTDPWYNFKEGMLLLRSCFSCYGVRELALVAPVTTDRLLHTYGGRQIHQLPSKRWRTVINQLSWNTRSFLLEYGLLFNDSSFETCLTVLQKSKVTTLSIHCDLNIVQMSLLGSLLKTNTLALRTLIIGPDHPIRFFGNPFLFENLAENTTLRRLDITYSTLTNNDIQALANALKKNTFIEELTLSLHGANVNAVRALIDLFQVNKTLKHIRLSGLVDVELQMLFENLGQSRLESITLEQVGMFGGSQQALIGFIQSNQYLKELNIKSHIDEFYLKGLTEALGKSKTIKKYNIPSLNKAKTLEG